MDPLKKRIKLKNNSVYETFEVFSDKILQHLTGQELKNLSEVSRKFNQIVEKSDVTSQKLAVVIKENPNKLFKADDIRSARYYKYLKIQELVNPSSVEEISDFINIFSYILEHIETCYDFELPLTLHLPILSTLIMNINYKTNLYINGLLEKTTELKKLHINGKTFTPLTIINCLDSNPNLEELVLEKGASEIVFRFIGEIRPFELRTLKLDNVDFSGKVELTNFVQFICEHSDTLTEIKLFRCEMELLSDILKILKNLVKLTYNPPFYEIDGSHANFQVHLGIRELNLIMVGMKDTKKLMSVAPRARKIYIAEATEEIFQYAIQRLPALREFHYAYFKDLPSSVVYIRNLYQWVIQMNPRYNKNVTFHQI